MKTPAASGLLVDQTNSFVSGREYVIACSSSIKDDQSVTIAHCAVLGVPVAKTGSTVKDGLDYASMPESNPSDEFLWKITDEGNGRYALYSVSQRKYMSLVNGQILLTAEKATVKGVFSGGEVYFMNDAGEYLRFTNVNKSRFHCNSLNARKFKLFSAEALPGEYREKSGPLLSVACFSDMHHEYGIQYWDTPYRNSSKTAVDYIKNTLGGVDVLLIGGDISGRRTASSGGNLIWTGGSDVINNFQKKNYQLFQSATSSGKVMVVTGNHDPEPSVHMSGGYPSANSNDWSSYMKQGVGAFEASVTYSDLNLSTEGIPSQYQNEVLGYRYTVNGIPFIGLCTPFGDRRDVGQTGHNGLYAAQVEWLEEQLTAIGKNKTVVVLCHYPTTSIPTVANGGAKKTAVLSDGEAETKMNSVLAKFPNVIYSYGHIHGDNSRIAKNSTSELVVPSGSCTLQSDNSYKTSGWISAFMGSLGYYGNSHQSSLSDADSKVVQFLVMDFYADHITFRYYNTGSHYAPGGVEVLRSFTVQRDLSAQFGVSGGSSGRPGASDDSDYDYDSGDDYDWEYGDDYGYGDDYDPDFDTDAEYEDLSGETVSGTGTASPSDGAATDTGTPSDGTDDNPDGTQSSSGPGAGTSSSGAGASGTGKKPGSATRWIVLGVSGGIVLAGAGFGIWYFIRKKKKA